MAVNVTLPTFAAERRLQAYQLSTDSLQTRAPSNKSATAVVDRWHRQTDRQTDTRPLHRPSSAYYTGSINNYTARLVRWFLHWLNHCPLSNLHVVLIITTQPSTTTVPPVSHLTDDDPRLNMSNEGAARTNYRVSYVLSSDQLQES